MKFIKGKQDGHQFGIRIYLDPWVLGSKSIELSFGKWYAGIEWGKV